MCQSVIFSLLLVSISCRVAADYFLILTSNGPVVRGAEITFKAKLYTSNGNEADTSTYQYQWEDNAIPYHNRDVKKQGREDEWTITYPADDYLPGPYITQVEVSRCIYIGCYLITSKRLNFTITSQLNGQMNLKQDNTLRPNQYVSNNSMIEHEIALLPPDYLYLKNNATSIITYWFIDCEYYGMTNNFTFSYKFTKPESQHVVEAIITAGFEPITIPAPTTTTTTSITTTTTTTPKPTTITTTTSKPSTTIPTSTTTKKSNISDNAIHRMKRLVQNSNTISTNGSSVILNKTFPFVCLNQTNIAPDPKKLYGYFSRNMIVKDGGSPSRLNTTQLLINIKNTPINDSAPRFHTSLFQESVSESVPIGYSIVRVQAYDADEGPNGDIRYSISPGDSTGGSTSDIPLSVDSQNGWIITTRELDREEHSKYMFQVVASDQGNPQFSSSASVIVTIQDVNDNDPVFEPKIYEAIVNEDDASGTPVATVTATDLDEDQRLHYELTEGNTGGRFSITSQNGRGLITVAQPLDYKQEKRYILTVTASDSGGRYDTATIYINISDANNFAPVFENAPYTAAVFEDAPVGTTVLVVSATDNDVGINAQISYSLGDEVTSFVQPTEFSINPQTGAVVTTKLLDRESISGYLLTVTAKDGGNPPLIDITDIEISVTDVNDNHPIFKQQSYSGNILEDTVIGTFVIQVSATDSDIGLNRKIRYSLSDKDTEDGTFVIDPISGVIRTNKGLDRNSDALYELKAVALDCGSPSLSTEVNYR